MFKERARITVYLEQDEARKLKRMAERDRVSVSTLLRRLIAQILKKEKNESANAAQRAE